MPVLPASSNLYPVQKFGLEGLNTFDDESDIEDIELADVRNMVFSNGLLQPRPGSLLYLAKPTEETNSPNQLLVATDSVGIDYMISVYANNFYLADTINTQWIRLNQAYTPPSSGLFYGSASWNRGIRDDRFYLGNGTDHNMKWVIAVNSLSIEALIADTKLSLFDTIKFLGNDGNPFATYTNTTISFTAPNVISDSTLGFLTSGFRTGQSIKITGSALNNGIFTIISVTAGEITVKETIVFEVAGASDTIAQLGIALIQNGSTAFTLYYDSVGTNYTVSTISFTSPHTISDSANGFLTAGFAPGQKIGISGSFQNDGAFTIVSVTAGTMVVVESVEDQVAGLSITITAPTLNLDATVGQNVPIHSTVTTPLIDMGEMPRGKVMTVSQGNLFLSNFIGSENTINFSRLGDPEDFTITTADPNTAGFYTVYHGKGGIIDMKDFGQYLVIEKQDIILQWIFTVSSSGDLLESVEPIIAGDGIGPVSNANSMSYMNELYYPTSKQGIIQFSPTTTGSQTTSGLTVLSQKINNLVVDVLDFSLARTCGLGQKLYWTVALPTIGIQTSINNLILMYDLVRASENPTASAWTVFDNINATDIKPVNNNLFILSANDGAVYQIDVPGIYQDAIDTNPVPYTAYALSKRFNLNQPAQLMRSQYVYVEGYISLNTTFYIRALYNESGSLGSQAYVIKGTDTNITTNPFTGGLGRFILGSPVLGGVDLETLQQFQRPLFFRVYLETSQAFREHNIQLQCFSNTIGSFWGISKIVLITQPENSIETNLVYSPGTAPMLTIQSL